MNLPLECAFGSFSGCKIRDLSLSCSLPEILLITYTITPLTIALRRKELSRGYKPFKFIIRLPNSMEIVEEVSNPV